jgi:uncharacterized LabA/DUF88 family protein
MTTPYHGQRVAVLVDTANMYHSARSLYGGRLDYRRLLEFTSRGRHLVRAIAFVVRTEDVDITPFLDALQAVGYETRVKTLKRRMDGSTRGDWDVGIALSAAALAERVDVISLVSGDGDFVELVDHLAPRGVRVEVCAFEDAVSAELRARASAFLPLDRDLILETRG